MAEDKRIRVTTDASPLQELRQGVNALYGDMNKLEDGFKTKAEASLNVIQKQVDLLKQRNILLEGGNAFSGQHIPFSSPTYITPYTGGLNNRYNPFNSPGQFGRMGFMGSSDRQLTVLDKILAEVIRISSIIEKGERDNINQPGGDGGAPVIPGGGSGGGGGVPIPIKGGGNFRIPTSMSGLLGMLPFGMALAGIGSMIGQQAKFEATQYSAENRFQRENNKLNHWLFNMITFGVSGSESQKREISRASAEQNDRALSDYSALHNYSYQESFARQRSYSYSSDQQDQISNLKDVPRRLKIKSNGSGITGVFSGLVGNTIDYIMGEHSSDDKAEIKRKSEEAKKFNISYDEHPNWASNTLGLNMTDYLSRVVNLEKSAAYSNNSGDIRNSNSATNQLLMAGRIRGISDQDQEQLMRSTRFSRGSGDAGSALYSFDTTMQKQGKEDQYISSILPEIVQQFSRISDSILEKTGSINVENVVRSMTSIQAATGTEGRQLERLQNAFMGKDVSQDDVTQALLLRTARQLNPNGNLSDLQAMIEEMPNNPELQKSFMEMINGISGGKESRRQMLKQIFPNLKINDIKAAEDKDGNLDVQKLLDKGVYEQGDYSSEDAESKVSKSLKSKAATDNRKTNRGYDQIFTPAEIKNMLESITNPIPVTIANQNNGDLGIWKNMGDNSSYKQGSAPWLEMRDEIIGLRKDINNIKNIEFTITK